LVVTKEREKYREKREQSQDTHGGKTPSARKGKGGLGNECGVRLGRMPVLGRGQVCQDRWERGGSSGGRKIIMTSIIKHHDEPSSREKGPSHFKKKRTLRKGIGGGGGKQPCHDT